MPRAFAMAAHDGPSEVLTAVEQDGHRWTTPWRAAEHSTEL
ncbi:MAG: hypothetical protein ACKOCN_07625 [Planctomycetaceae bacterium]